MIFSVIIPLYNGAGFIKGALDSVLSQTNRDYEIVICDDGSKDDSGQMVESYIRDHPEVSINYIRQENRGLGGARNTAMRNAKGDIIALLDQDDIWYPQKLASLDKAFEETGADIICHEEDVLKCGKKVGRSYCCTEDNDMFRRLLFRGNCLSTSATAFKRSVFVNIGFFSEDKKRLHFVEDYEYWLRAAFAGYKFGFIKDVLGAYVLHEDNISRTKIRAMVDGEINVIVDNFKRLDPVTLPDRFRINRRKASVYAGGANAYLMKGDIVRALSLFLLSLMMNPFHFIEYPVKKVLSKAARAGM